MHTMRVLEREERETNIKNIRRDDTLKNYFNLRENINLQIQGAQWIPMKFTDRHAILKMLQFQRQEENLKNIKQ